jgi:uncharacterized protein YjbJ (UPF0337 family)
MKKRTTQSTAGRSPEFKGVVKKIAGKLTNRPDIEQEGRAEMRGGKTASGSRKPRASLHSDPHRRG